MPLKAEKLAFPVEAAGETAEGTSGGEHAVAGDEHGDGIGATGLADGACGLGPAQGAGEFAVGACAAGGNAQERAPKLLLHFCAAGEVEWRKAGWGFSF